MTKKQIKEEFKKWSISDEYGYFLSTNHQDKIIDWLILKIDSSMKEQKKKIINKIEKISDFADSADTYKQRIINLINK